MTVYCVHILYLHISLLSCTEQYATYSFRRPLYIKAVASGTVAHLHLLTLHHAVGFQLELTVCTDSPPVVQSHRPQRTCIIPGIFWTQEGFKAQVTGDCHRAEKRGV